MSNRQSMKSLSDVSNSNSEAMTSEQDEESSTKTKLNNDEACLQNIHFDTTD